MFCFIDNLSRSSFANNNANYVRLLPIHLNDMINLEHTHPQINVELH